MNIQVQDSDALARAMAQANANPRLAFLNWIIIDNSGRIGPISSISKVQNLQ